MDVLIQILGILAMISITAFLFMGDEIVPYLERRRRDKAKALEAKRKHDLELEKIRLIGDRITAIEYERISRELEQQLGKIDPE